MIKKQFILPSVETNNFYEKDLKTYYNLSIQSPISIKAQLYIVEIVLNKIYSIFKSTKENKKEFINKSKVIIFHIVTRKVFHLYLYLVF